MIVERLPGEKVAFVQGFRAGANTVLAYVKASGDHDLQEHAEAHINSTLELMEASLKPTGDSAP